MFDSKASHPLTESGELFVNIEKSIAKGDQCFMAGI